MSVKLLALAMRITVSYTHLVPFDWQGDRPIAARSEELFIYEAHVGMALSLIHI